MSGTPRPRDRSRFMNSASAFVTGFGCAPCLVSLPVFSSVVAAFGILDASTVGVTGTDGPTLSGPSTVSLEGSFLLFFFRFS